MRFRDTVNSSTFELFTSLVGMNGNDPIEDYTSSFIETQNRHCMWDVVTPDYKRRVALGEIISNPMLQYSANLSHSPTKTTWGWTSYDNNLQDTYVRYDPMPSALLSVGEDSYGELMDQLDNINTGSNVAIAAAFANVDVSEAQALATLGEFPETVRWIIQLLRRAINLFRNLKKKLIRKLIRRLTKSERVDLLTNFWLEVRYAFRPLVYDMKSAVNALKKIIEQGIRLTARGYTQTVEDVTDLYIGSSSFSAVDFEYETKRRYQVDYRAGVLYSIDADINGLQAVWGLDQQFETIWELTPFSFIVDWFFNVGDVISSWSTGAGLSTLASWVTESFVNTHTTTIKQETIAYTSTSGGELTEFSYDSGKLVRTYQMKRRILSPERPILPQIDINLNLSKLFDLAAIGRGIYRSMAKH